jgi:hypothetical protein
MVVCPSVQVATAQLGSIVHDQHVRVAAFAGCRLEHTDHPLAGQREVDEDRRALTGAVILQIGGAELAAVGQAVLGEIERPALVGSDRAPGAGHHAAKPALLPATAAQCELLLPIQPVDELVVGEEALPTQQLVQPAITEASSLAGEGAQALAQTGPVPLPLGHALCKRARDADQPASAAA